MKSLADCVRKNLYRLRKSMKINQEELAEALGLKRTGYTKKETGVTPITLEDLDKIMGKHTNILLPDLLIGYPGCDYSQPAIGLDEGARKRFPFLDQVILTANLIADKGRGEDLEFLQQCLTYALTNLERERLGEGVGDHKVAGTR